MSKSPYHPELALVRFLPSIPAGPRMVKLMRRAKSRGIDPGPDVTVEEIVISSTVSIRLFRPAVTTGPVPAMLWMHGGGHLFGAPEQDDRPNIAFVRELGIAVAARSSTSPAKRACAATPRATPTPPASTASSASPSPPRSCTGRRASG
jgi:hypothetical protein